LSLSWLVVIWSLILWTLAIIFVLWFILTDRSLVSSVILCWWLIFFFVTNCILFVVTLLIHEIFLLLFFHSCCFKTWLQQLWVPLVRILILLHLLLWHLLILTLSLILEWRSFCQIRRITFSLWKIEVLELLIVHLLKWKWLWVWIKLRVHILLLVVLWLGRRSLNVIRHDWCLICSYHRFIV
jgi:hypothetical protein